MNAEKLIKTIDPHYGKCLWCRRLIHRSKLSNVRLCTDAEDCQLQKDKDAGKRVNQRDRSRLS